MQSEQHHSLPKAAVDATVEKMIKSGDGSPDLPHSMPIPTPSSSSVVFRFFGFGDKIEREQDRTSRATLQISPLRITSHFDALLVQRGAFDSNGEIILEAGLLRSGGRSISAPSADDLIEPSQHIDSPVLDLGYIQGHYGHFLLESMAKLWCLPLVDAGIPVVAHHLLDWYALSREAQEVDSFRTTILGELGVRPDRIVPLITPARVRQLLVPDAAYELYGFAHVQMTEPHRHVTRQLLGSDPPAISDQPVYLSRRLFDGWKGRVLRRRMLLEWELETLLQQQGFLVVYPEQLSFEEQVRLVNGHREFLSVWGSQVYSLLFSLIRPRLHLISDIGVFRDYLLAPAAAGVSVNFINGLRRLDDGDLNGPALLDIPLIVGYLVDAGLLPAHTRNLKDAATQAGDDLLAEAHMVYVLTPPITRREKIPAEALVEAARLADTSWALSSLLGFHYAGSDPAAAREHAARFVRLAGEERGSERLRIYRAEVVRHAQAVLKVADAALAGDLQTVLLDRFGIDVGL